jgi:hypothetical protein
MSLIERGFDMEHQPFFLEVKSISLIEASDTKKALLGFAKNV